MTRAISASPAVIASARLTPPLHAPSFGGASSATDGIGEFLFESRMMMPGTGRGIHAGDTAEGGADAHADTGGVALAEHVASDHFAGGEQVAADDIAEATGRRLVGLHAEIGEGDAGLERIGIE